ncbi:hypothetical protein BASA83_000504 [Batrachochytrium salamandrivorans]|nr:hypothetical protein BASA83_000504 [Batrachochytrium salamandrivorans]
MPDSSTGGDVAEVEAEEAATPAECGGDDQGKKDATGDEGDVGRKSKSTVSATPIRGSTLPVQHDQSDMDDYDHSVGDAKTTKGASSGAKRRNGVVEQRNQH